MNKLPEIKQIKLGKYKHFKGGEYEVLKVVRDSETLEGVVIYKALYGDNEEWARPLENFVSEKEVDGEMIPRFKYIGD